jgi:hypothetical protein
MEAAPARDDDSSSDVPLEWPEIPASKPHYSGNDLWEHMMNPIVRDFMPIRKIIPILFVVTLLIPSASFAEKLDFVTKNGKFFTSEGEIPAGCIARLRTELNGDNSVAAVYLNRTSLRGCIDANTPYPESNEDEISYEIDGPAGENTYRISVCESVDGSMGRYCDKIIVQFANRSYATPEGRLNVLSLEKLGEW